MEMKEALKLAIKEGYQKGNFYFVLTESVKEDAPESIKEARDRMLLTEKEKYLLDPVFWQSLGKALGWSESKDFEKNHSEVIFVARWLYVWHQFIDWVANGKNVDEFFKELI